MYNDQITDRIETSQYKGQASVTGSVLSVPKWVTMLTCRTVTVTAGSEMLVALAIGEISISRESWRLACSLTRELNVRPWRDLARSPTWSRPDHSARSSTDWQGLGEREVQKSEVQKGGKMGRRETRDLLSSATSSTRAADTNSSRVSHS